MKYIIHNNDYTKEVDSLMNFAQKRMGFSNKPNVLFSDDPANGSKTLGKTGYYDPNTTEIRIFMTGRHVKDILRSLAHELVHHMQNEKGDLNHDGYMGQGYAQKNPQMREMERQAYEIGNLCFRDWEDSLKEKHPTIYNERRNHKMSLKDWKNKQLNENLNEKWGFKMNLNEMGMHPGAHIDSDEAIGSVYGQEPPMSDQEVAIEQCVEEKTMMGMSGCEARPACEEEVAGVDIGDPMNMPPGEANRFTQDVPFQESLKRSIRVKFKK